MKIEIEERRAQFLARLIENYQYVGRYGQTLIFRAKTKKRAIELAKWWLARERIQNSEISIVTKLEGK